MYHTKYITEVSSDYMRCSHFPALLYPVMLASDSLQAVSQDGWLPPGSSQRLGGRWEKPGCLYLRLHL